MQLMRKLAPAGAAALGDDGRATLRVMTYNVLAQVYVKSRFFPYCTPSVLRWKHRSKELEGVFAALPVQPDIVCLQEVDMYDEFWAEMMQRAGYTGLYAQKTLGKKDGAALFWQSAAFELVEHRQLLLDEPVGDESDCSADLLARVQRGNVALVARLKQIGANASTTSPLEVVVATTHLFWDPAQEDVKRLQVRRVLRLLHEYAQALQLPVVFAGDFNSLPNSKVYDLITREHQFASAYAQYKQDGGVTTEPDFTNVNGATESSDTGAQVASFVGTLDYVFYHPPSKIEPVALLELMSLEDATRAVALPSELSPSDHLPLLAEFRVRV